MSAMAFDNAPFQAPAPDGRHILDIDAEVRRRIDQARESYLYSSMAKLLLAAEASLKMAELCSSNRGRRDQAYVEYAVARELVTFLVPKNREYIDMIQGNSPQNEKRWKDLRSRLAANDEKISNIRHIIVAENTRNGVSPANPASILTLQASESSASSRPSSVSSDNHRFDEIRQPVPVTNAPQFGITGSPKSKPPVRPKPEALHGNAIRDLQSRFNALRPNAPTNGNTPASTNLSVEKSVLRMPSASDFRPVSSPPPVDSLSLGQGIRPSGPRPMPAQGLPSGPRLPPKIPIDTKLASSLPRPPSPAYSPARNMQTPASVDPPRTTPRSIVGTGGRSNSLAAAVSARTSFEQESGSYFPRVSSQLTSGESRRKGVVGIPAPADVSITAERLFDYLKLYNILLIDMRSRQEFDEGHIDSSSIMCVEPLQLRMGMSGADVENSLSISPDEEEALFAARDKFQLVVYYDQSTDDTTFQQSPRTETEEKLRILHEALVEFNFDKPLKNHPMVLIGGLNAWVQLLGQPALKQSQTQVKRGPRRRSSTATLPDSLLIGKRRVRGEWNPLNPEEERQWAEQARSESFNLPQMPELPDEDEIEMTTEPDGSLPFYRSEEEFFRRYPAVPVIQESMSSTMSNSPPPFRSSAHQPQYPTYNPDAGPHEMPSRPAPAAPRVSYSGAHDRTVAPYYNAARTRHPPPYISPKEKPSNVRLPRTGLVNFGTTCYMNSIIQCLNATVPLVRRFQDGSYKQWVQRENWKGSRGLLPEYFANLVSNLWLNDVTAVRPLTFRKFCARLNTEWGTDIHQDANDFYIFVMEFLHEDLNIYWRNPPAHVLSKEEEAMRETTPMFLAASIEWDRWSKRERSLIADLFGGQHASQLRCLTCNTTSTTYEPWFNISIEIPPGRQTSLENCLESYCQQERLQKGQEWTCPNCKTNRDATKKIILTKAPQYLVIHLKRFHMEGSTARKDSRIVDFPLQGLDMTPYMLPVPTERQQQSTKRQLDQSILGPFTYNAYAVIEHFGKGLQSGHYIALVHDRPRQVWRRFDDSGVTDSASIRPDGAYLLFYERIDR